VAPTWQSWLDAAGISGIDASRGTHFSLPDHGLQASMDGAGIVLGWRHMSKEHLAAGRVVEPFDLIVPLGQSFYLVYPEAHSHRQHISLLREWLLQEVREEQKELGEISLAIQ